MDIFTVGAGVISFGIFLLIHMITIRWVRPEHLLRSLLSCVIAALACPVVIMYILFAFKMTDAPVYAWVCAGLLSSLVQGLLCFVYVLCIFGPYETSIRMRLVREIKAGGPTGISLQELLSKYNPQTIVQVRLKRLLGSGDIVEKDGRYQIGHSRNFFFIFDAIAGGIKKCIGR